MENMMLNILEAILGARGVSFLVQIPVILAANEQEPAVPDATDAIDKAVKSATTVFMIVMIAVGLLAVAFIGLKLWRELGAQDLLPGGEEDNLTKARKYEKKGEYVLAAAYYEKVVGARSIEGSDPGLHGGVLLGPPPSVAASRGSWPR